MNASFLPGSSRFKGSAQCTQSNLNGIVTRSNQSRCLGSFSRVSTLKLSFLTQYPVSSCAQEKMTIERFWSIFKKQHGAMVDSSSQNWDEFHKKYHTQAFHYSCDNEDYMLRNPDGYLQRKRLTGFINSSSSTNSPPSKGPTKHDPKMKIRWHLNLSSCFGCPAAPWVGFDMLYYSWNPWKESIWKISSACKTRFSNCSYMQHICSCLLPSTNSVDALDLTFQF